MQDIEDLITAYAHDIDDGKLEDNKPKDKVDNSKKETIEVKEIEENIDKTIKKLLDY